MNTSVTVRISPDVLLSFLAGDGLGVEYQPILRVADGELVAYEALARFRHERLGYLPPDQVFRQLHDSPLSLFQLELLIKRLQLEACPAGTPVFLNIDQDAFEVFLGEDRHPMVELLLEHQQAVVEIIENSSVADARVSIAMQQAFGGAGIPLALDDLGAHDSLVSFDVLLGVQYLKLARDWLSRLSSPAAMALLRGILSFARDAGKTVILEGVEDEAQMRWAREQGIDCVQGFLFRDRFVRHWAGEILGAGAGCEEPA